MQFGLDSKQIECMALCFFSSVSYLYGTAIIIEGYRKNREKQHTYKKKMGQNTNCIFRKDEFWAIYCGNKKLNKVKLSGDLSKNIPSKYTLYLV